MCHTYDTSEYATCTLWADNGDFRYVSRNCKFYYTVFYVFIYNQNGKDKRKTAGSGRY